MATDKNWLNLHGYEYALKSVGLEILLRDGEDRAGVYARWPESGESPQ